MASEKPKNKIGRPPTIKNPRTRILAVSSKVFYEAGFARGTISNIAKEMGKSKAFVFHYFKTKEQIIEEITVDTYEKLIETTIKQLDICHTDKDRILKYMISNALFLDDNYYEMQVVHHEFTLHLSTPLAIKAQELDAKYLELLVDIFRSGAASGELLSVDPKMSARVVFSTMNSLARWYRPEDPHPAAHYAEEFFVVIWNGYDPANHRDAGVAMCPVSTCWTD